MSQPPDVKPAETLGDLASLLGFTIQFWGDFLWSQEDQDPCEWHYVAGCDWFSAGWIFWVLPRIGVPQNGWFIMENPIENGWFWGYPYFRKHPQYFLGSSKLAGCEKIRLDKMLSCLYTNVSGFCYRAVVTKRAVFRLECALSTEGHIMSQSFFVVA